MKNGTEVGQSTSIKKTIAIFRHRGAYPHAREKPDSKVTKPSREINKMSGKKTQNKCKRAKFTALPTITMSTSINYHKVRVNHKSNLFFRSSFTSSHVIVFQLDGSSSIPLALKSFTISAEYFTTNHFQ